MVKWNPLDYQTHSSEQQKWAREVIAKLGLRGDERVLDIGCGDGKVTAEIAAALPHGSALGIDSSPEMIEFAIVHHPPEAFANLRFELKDASALDYSGAFDVVFSNAALHWVFDHRPVLRGIHRALKTGGRMLLQMGGAGNAAEILAILDEMMPAEPWRTYFRDFSFQYGFHGPNDYRRWLGEAGLSAMRVELIPKDMTHDGPNGLAAWIRTTWMPYTHRIPQPQRPRFIDEIVQRYLSKHPMDAAGRVHVRMMRLEVEAMKAAG